MVLTSDRSKPWGVFLIFLRLGLTSFGGPVAHLGYFHHEFVTRRQWLTDQAHADLVALCQFLPGPASSQVGMAIGLSRSGYAGALAAWAGFTLPSAALLILFALGIANAGDSIPPGVLDGLKLVAAAVVAQALWGMARQLCPDPPRISLMAATACLVIVFPSISTQWIGMAMSGLIGLWLLTPSEPTKHDPLPMAITRKAGGLLLAAFFVLLVALPVAAAVFSSPLLSVVDAFYRAGSLVFGGGHVVLPLLHTEMVSSGWVSNETFLYGYGAAQAIPGPLFTFAAFLGASISQASFGWFSGLACLIVVFTPSFLLVVGILPFWEGLRSRPRVETALMGVNAGVVGLLLAALYRPVWVEAIHAPQDLGLVLVALMALMVWKLPPWQKRRRSRHAAHPSRNSF